MKKRIAAAIAVLVMCGTFTLSAQADPPTVCSGQNINDNRATDNDDFLVGSLGNDVIALGVGADQYFGDEGSDSLCGNEGADVLGGEGGPDTLLGGDGADLLAGLGGADTINGNDGTDEIQGGAGGDTIKGGTADGVADDLYDGPGSDTIIGGSGGDTWHRCGDNAADDHSGFSGDIVPDPQC